MPRITIYSDQDSTSNAKVSETQNILLCAGFTSDDITIVECDSAVAAAFGGEVQESPRIACDGKIVAIGMADIKKAESDGRLRALAPQPPSEAPVRSSWWNPAAALMSYWSGGEPERRGPSLGEPEYEVVRYNWLWRPQVRVYRFGDTTFDRLRPDTRAVRQTFAYNDILEMTMRADDYLVITFRSGAEAQHMQSPFVSVIRDLILLRLKALSADVAA